MAQGVVVRFLTPYCHPDGSIAYRIKTRHIRLPLKRGDRQELALRLTR